MTVAPAVLDQVRQQAKSACEYCGVTEADSAGTLTVDHYQPRSRGGTDELDNLLYSCYRCNLYKADYWPEQPGDPALWNPRGQSRSSHFLELADGTLYPTTPVGQFTLRRLRLNRAPLVAYRLRARAVGEEAQLLARYKDLLTLLEQLYEQQAALLTEHRAFLAEQRTWVRALPGPKQDEGR
jgi:hypothetical protein